MFSQPSGDQNAAVLKRAVTHCHIKPFLDEIHHAGDALTWGDGVREAFDPATRRLALTGTPLKVFGAVSPLTRPSM